MPGRKYNAHQTKRLTYRCTNLWAGKVSLKDIETLIIKSNFTAGKERQTVNSMKLYPFPNGFQLPVEKKNP